MFTMVRMGIMLMVLIYIYISPCLVW
jgi:hypothetical protein